jgi:hypothetical protein
MISAKVLIFLWCVGCAIGMAAQDQTTVSDSPERWTGCYQLRVVPKDLGQQVWGKLPRRFQLLAASAGHKKLPELRKATILDSRFKRLAWFSWWHLSADGKLKVQWASLYVGYFASLSQWGDELEGTVQPYSDYQPDGPYPAMNVTARRIVCRP